MKYIQADLCQKADIAVHTLDISPHDLSQLTPVAVFSRNFHGCYI